MLSFANILVACVAAVVVVALLLCYKSLHQAKGWSLTDALSENVSLTKTDAQGNPVDATGAPLAAGASPLEITSMKASSSRFIALLGTISILILYIGFGLVCLDKFATGTEIPDMAKGANFFYSGMVLFAPYLINKASAAFSFFGK